MSCGPSVPSPVAGVASLKQVSSQDRTEAAGAARLPEQPPRSCTRHGQGPGPAAPLHSWRATCFTCFCGVFACKGHSGGLVPENGRACFALLNSRGSYPGLSTQRGAEKSARPF